MKYIFIQILIIEFFSIIYGCLKNFDQEYQTNFNQHMGAVSNKKKHGPFKLQGVVLSANDSNPIADVVIVIKNTYSGTISNGFGVFEINVPDGDAILTFSCVGYQKLELAPNNIRNGTVFMIHEAPQCIVSARKFKLQR